VVSTWGVGDGFGDAADTLCARLGTKKDRFRFTSCPVDLLCSIGFRLKNS
jgi:hypothetical protein